jgi:murein DD-endopeptidase MepM/ murein hydrolase activator NlpD
MAEPIKIEQLGDQLVVLFDDNTRRVAAPTMGGLWYINDKYVAPPPPPPPTSSARFVWPFPLSAVSSEYGPRNGRIHQGIDFGFSPALNGAQIPAAAAGRAMVRRNDGFGNHVILDHGGGLFTVYAHIQNGGVRVSDGAHVAQRQTVGLVGNTGNSFGAHLHFETHVGGLNWSNPGTHRNPRDFMATYG